MAALALIIAAGAVLRFWRLEHPPLWGDEAMVFCRSNLGYRDLITYLRLDLFGPLHYSLYWVVGQFTDLSPWTMRAIPATWGALMPLAIYLLARQLARPSAALWCAALAAASAYWLSYSRDCKMYMPTWTLAAFAMAALLHYFRHGSMTALLAWVAASLAAAGHHLAFAMVLAVSPLGLAALSLRGRWTSLPGQLVPRLAFYVLGLAIIAAGPLVYYQLVNRVADRLEEDPERTLGLAGISWVNQRNAGRDVLNLTVDSYSAYLTGLEFAKPPREPADTGRFRFRTPGEVAERDQVPPWLINMQVITLVLLTAMGLMALLAWRAPPTDGRDQRWGLSLLLLGGWIVLPTYGFYLLSFDDTWRTGLGEWIASGLATYPNFELSSLLPTLHLQLAGGMLLASLGAPLLVRRWRLGWLAIAAVLPGTFIFCALYAWQQNPREALPWARALSDLLASPISLALLLGPLPGLLLWTAPSSWREGRFDQLRRLPRAVVANLGIVAAVLAVILLGMGLVELALADRLRGSTWMPRYLGAITPAVCIAIVLLLLRLPAFVGYTALVGLIGLNIANGVARIVLDSEAPVDVAIADLAEAHKAATEGRSRDLMVILDSLDGGAHPSEGWVRGAMGFYYAAVALDMRCTPMEFVAGKPFRELASYATMVSGSRDAASAARRRNVSRLVVWWREVPPSAFSRPRIAEPPPDESLERDRILSALGTGWTRVDSRVYHVRHHWNWRLFGWVWRREYVRIQPPAAAFNAADEHWPAAVQAPIVGPRG